MKIGLVIQFRLFDGFSHESFSRKMQNSIDRIFSEGASEILGIADIALKSRCSFDEGVMSGRKVIEDERLKSRSFERLYGVTSDIPGASGDEDHEVNLLK